MQRLQSDTGAIIDLGLMKTPFRKLSALLLVSALLGMTALLALDVWNRLTLTAIHQRLGALSFILIGSSYICLQLGSRQSWREKMKRIFLGVGFFLWGSEQFMSPGVLVTVMDSLVVIIFVSDLSLVILDSLKCKGDKVP